MSEPSEQNKILTMLTVMLMCYGQEWCLCYCCYVIDMHSILCVRLAMFDRAAIAKGMFLVQLTILGVDLQAWELAR